VRSRRRRKTWRLTVKRIYEQEYSYQKIDTAIQARIIDIYRNSDNCGFQCKLAARARADVPCTGSQGARGSSSESPATVRRLISVKAAQSLHNALHLLDYLYSDLLMISCRSVVIYSNARCIWIVSLLLAVCTGGVSRKRHGSLAKNWTSSLLVFTLSTPIPSSPIALAAPPNIPVERPDNLSAISTARLLSRLFHSLLAPTKIQLPTCYCDNSGLNSSSAAIPSRTPIGNHNQDGYGSTERPLASTGGAGWCSFKVDINRTLNIRAPMLS
jgi:hypothetical protein